MAYTAACTCRLSQGTDSDYFRLSSVGFLPACKPYITDGSGHRTDDACTELSPAERTCQYHHDELRPVVNNLHLWTDSTPAAFGR